jgi:hypothetical protein
MHTNKSLEKIVFYNVGEEDDINSALKKNLDKNCGCAKGKSTSMDINGINIENAKLIKEIKEIVKIDNDLRNWGSGTKVESMPIDVLHCVSKIVSAFNYWDYFFSNIDGKLLSIIIYVKDESVVNQQLFSKHGKCIKNDYCVNNDNLLFLVKDNDKTFILVFFEKNIKNHYAKIKKQEVKKRKLEEKSLKEAF